MDVSLSQSLDEQQKSALSNFVRSELSKVIDECDDVIVEYVMVMIYNGKTMLDISNELEDFVIEPHRSNFASSLGKRIQDIVNPESTPATGSKMISLSKKSDRAVGELRTSREGVSASAGGPVPSRLLQSALQQSAKPEHKTNKRPTSNHSQQQMHNKRARPGQHEVNAMHMMPPPPYGMDMMMPPHMMPPPMEMQMAQMMEMYQQNMMAMMMQMQQQGGGRGGYMNNGAPGGFAERGRSVCLVVLIVNIRGRGGYRGRGRFQGRHNASYHAPPPDVPAAATTADTEAQDEAPLGPIPPHAASQYNIGYDAGRGRGGGRFRGRAMPSRGRGRAPATVNRTWVKPATLEDSLTTER